MRADGCGSADDQKLKNSERVPNHAVRDPFLRLRRPFDRFSWVTGRRQPIKGRLPWLALFLRRSFFFRARLPMAPSLVDANGFDA